jgi:hypothetical protein
MVRFSSISKRRPTTWPAARGRKTRVSGLALAAILACHAGLSAAPNIFDDDWKPPPEAAAPEQEPRPTTTAPAGPATPARGPTPRMVPWTVPTAAQAEAPQRVAVPDAASIAAAEKKVKAAYRSEYTSKVPEKKATLAGLLLAETQHRGIDPGLLYVLLEEARGAAAANGEPEIAVEAARGMRDAFQLTPQAARDLQQSALASAIASMPQATSPADAGAAYRAADLAMQLAEFDLDQGDYAAAVRAARPALIAARKSADADFSLRVSARMAQIEALGAEYEQDKDDIAGLKANPGDATGNLAAGRLYMFFLDRPHVGLPFLAKGLDPVLKSLAARDLALGGAAPPGAAPAPASAAGGEAQLAAGDGWADASKTQAGADPPVKDGMQRRALYWYDRAAEALPGAAQAVARKRARDLRASRAVPGVSGEYYRGQDFGYRVFTRTDAQIQFDWAGNPPEFVMGGENFSVRWTGFIKAHPGRYGLTAIHNDGVRVWFDGQLIIDKWGANVGRDAASIELNGALQEVKVEYTQHTAGSYMGIGWVAPGTTRASAIPAEALYHDPLPPGSVYASLTRSGRDGKIELAAAAAVSHGGPRFVQDGKSAAHLDHWADAADWVSWDFAAPEGEYDVDILYSCDPQWAGGAYSLTVGNNFLAGPVPSTGSWSDFHTAHAGRARLAGGLQWMQVKSTKMPHSPLWHLSQVTMTPVNGAPQAGTGGK